MGVAKCCMIVVGILLTLVGLGMIGFNFVGKGIIIGFVKVAFVALAPSEVLSVTDTAARVDFYLYNITNVKSMLTGASLQPEVTEIGPFVFKAYDQTIDVKYDTSGNYASKSVSFYQYLQGASCEKAGGNCKADLTDKINVIDSTYHGLVSGMLHGSLGEAGGAALFGAMTSQVSCNRGYPKHGIPSFNVAAFTGASIGARAFFSGNGYTDCETKLAMMDDTDQGKAFRAASGQAAVNTALSAIVKNVTRYDSTANGGHGTTCYKYRASCFARLYKNKMTTRLVVLPDMLSTNPPQPSGAIPGALTVAGGNIAPGGTEQAASSKIWKNANYYQIYGTGQTVGAMTILTFTGNVYNVADGSTAAVTSFDMATDQVMSGTTPTKYLEFAIVAGSPTPKMPLMTVPCGAGHAVSTCPTPSGLTKNADLDNKYAAIVHGSFAVGPHAIQAVYTKMMDTTKFTSFLAAATDAATNYPVFNCLGQFSTAAQTAAATACATAKGSACDAAEVGKELVSPKGYACDALINYWDAVDAQVAGTKAAVQMGIMQTIALGNLTKGSFRALHMYAVYGAMLEVKGNTIKQVMAGGGDYATGQTQFQTAIAGFTANDRGPMAYYNTDSTNKWTFKRAQVLFGHYINTVVPAVLPKPQYFSLGVTTKQALLTGYVSPVGHQLHANGLSPVAQPAQNLLKYHTVPKDPSLFSAGLTGTPERHGSSAGLHKVKQMSGDGGWTMGTIIPKMVAPSSTDKCGDVLMTTYEAKYGSTTKTLPTLEKPSNAYQMKEVDGKTTVKGICKKTATSGWSSQWVAEEQLWGKELTVSGKTSGFKSKIFNKDFKYEGTESLWYGSIGRPQKWTYSTTRVASTPKGTLPANVGLYQLERTTLIDATDRDASVAGAGDKSCGADGQQDCPLCMKDISPSVTFQAHIALSGPNFQDCDFAQDSASFAKVTDHKGKVRDAAFTKKKKWTTLVAPYAGTRVGLDSNTGVYAKLTRADLSSWSASLCTADSTKKCESDLTVTNSALCAFTSDNVWTSPQEWPGSLAACKTAANQDIYIPLARIHINTGMDEASELLIAGVEFIGNVVTGPLGQTLLIAGIAVVVLGLVCCVCGCKKSKDKVEAV
jgi:hypothetical protein